jgi:hypothetical protein
MNPLLKLSILLQFTLIMLLGLPVLAVIVVISTINRLIEKTPDITIVWRRE